MVSEIRMPKLGWTMEEGILAEWLKHDGDEVKAGDLLFTVESDKALQEVEAFDSGILRIPPDAPPPGSMVKVGVLLAYLAQPDEALPFATSPYPPVSSPTPAGRGGEDSTIQPVSRVSIAHTPRTNGDLPCISPRARRVAGELGVDWTRIGGSGRTGRIVERDVRAAHEQRLSQPEPTPSAVEITPVARRAAQELGVDVNTLAAQFPGRRITREDVEAAAKTAPASALAERAPITRVRRVIAERMAQSAHTTAAVTLTTEVDATELVRIRQQLKNDANRVVPTYNDLLMKLTAGALQEHPTLNARFDGDDLVTHVDIHIGLAVDTERGLLVPVVRDVPRKSVRQIAAESAALVERARAGSLHAEDLQGSTFSITNLGMYDIDAFTPIINLPECAILGIGRIVPKQVVVDVEAERLAIRHMLPLSLTFDHRLVDGAPAARFLQRVKQFVEQPYLWLVG